MNVFGSLRFGLPGFIHYTSLEMIAIDLLVWVNSGGTHPPFSLKSRSLSSIPSHLCLLHSVGTNDGVTWNTPSWSISCEWVAYICFAVFARRLMTLGRVAAAVVLLLVLIGYVAFCAGCGGLTATYDFGLVRCLLGFFAGVMLFLLLDGCSATDLSSGLVYCSSLLLVSVGFVVTSKVSFDAVIIPFFLILVAVLSRPDSSVGKFTLEASLMQFIGEVSFSFYMTHWLFLASVPAIFKKVFSVDTRLSEGSLLFNCVSASVIVVGSFLVSVCTYRFIESPARRLARWLLSR